LVAGKPGGSEPEAAICSKAILCVHREMTDPAGRAGDQHALAEQRCAVPQRAQRGQAGNRQRGCSGKADRIGQYGDALRRHRGAFGPAEFVHQRDNACASRRTAPIRRLPQHNAADVLAGYPALLVIAERPQLAAI
jgi:hypothetical protein